MKSKVNRIKADLELAKHAWDRRFIDDEHIDTACTSLMYSVELGLKYLIEMNGDKVPKTHSIKVLLANIPSKYYSSNWYSTLDCSKHITNDWYSESRYDDNFSAISTIVEDYIIACEEMLSDINNNVSYVETTETKVKKILNKLNYNKTASEVLKYLPEADVPDDVLYTLVLDILRNKISKNQVSDAFTNAVSKMSE